MFLVNLKTLLIDSMRNTFDADYPEPDFRNVLVSMEFPIKEESYPSIWVDYEPTFELEIAGVGHYERTQDKAGGIHTFQRWNFQGYAVYTIVALSSLEHARLFDEVCRIMAFSGENPQTSEFRATIENNEFIAINFDFDKIKIGGFATTQGTPWGTDEIMYEATVSMEIVGEFVSDGSTQELVNLRKLEVYPYATNEPDPTLDQPDTTPWS